MFERFTQEAKAVLVAAQDVAIELGARHIGPGHLLYGCTEGQETSAGEPLRSCGVTGAAVRRFLPRAEELAAGEIDSDALRVIGIDYDGVRAAVEKTFGEGSLGAAPDRRAASARVRKPPFSADAKRSLALSLRVASGAARPPHPARSPPARVAPPGRRLRVEHRPAVWGDDRRAVGRGARTGRRRLRRRHLSPRDLGRVGRVG